MFDTAFPGVDDTPFPPSMKSCDGDFVAITYRPNSVLPFVKVKEGMGHFILAVLKPILILLPFVVSRHVENGNKILIGTTF